MAKEGVAQRKRYIAAARDLNEALGLKPPINVRAKNDALTAAIVENTDCPDTPDDAVALSDELKDDTWAVLEELKCGPKYHQKDEAGELPEEAEDEPETEDEDEDEPETEDEDEPETEDEDEDEDEPETEDEDEDEPEEEDETETEAPKEVAKKAKADAAAAKKEAAKAKKEAAKDPRKPKPNSLIETFASVIDRGDPLSSKEIVNECIGTGLFSTNTVKVYVSIYLGALTRFGVLVKEVGKYTKA